MALMMHERAMETLSPARKVSVDVIASAYRLFLTSIHPSVKKLDLGHLDGLSSGLGQTVALVVGLGRIDRIYLSRRSGSVRAGGVQMQGAYTGPRDQTTEPAGYGHRQGRRSGGALESSQQLFAAFIRHEIDSCTNSVAHWHADSGLVVLLLRRMERN